MKHVIAGTAGHIDHGKTSLVRALTGIDTDRLEEEKRRGISIDLGFAHLDLPDLHIALIDVPGHEKFIKNMLAGVGGIDLVLFIIAADESIKPQTREHLDICRLLRITDGVVVLTKTDLVDPELVDLVEMEARELVAGVFRDSVTIVPVSAASGAGIAELREALASVARRVKTKDSRRPFRLPVDRVFTMTGFGTVVTGTVLDGVIEVEQEVEAHPTGDRFRVRGIQVHGEKADRAVAGQRSALNLTGGSLENLARGVVLSAPGQFAASRAIDCELELLASADPLKNDAPIHFHAGTAELTAEVRLLESPLPLQPGETQFARVILQTPTLLFPGDRFIIRRFSPLVTIGGGRVIDAHPPRLSRARSLERSRKLAFAPLADRIAALAAEAPLGLSVKTLVQRTGESVRRVLESLPDSVCRYEEWFVDRERAASVINLCVAHLAEFHRTNPLAPGLGKEELRTKFFAGAPPGVFDALLAGSHLLKVTGEIAHLAKHKVVLQAEEGNALTRIERAFEEGGLAVPSVGEVLQNCGVNISKARTLLQMLVKDKRLIRVSDDLMYHARTVDQLRSVLRGRRGERFSVAQFKDWTGVSRKYAIPLLEFLDRERVTRREGDARVVL